jgi:uncharacterized protein YkwD
MKVKIVIILILIIGAFGAGVYFRDDAINFYNNFNKNIEDLKKQDIGQIILQVQKQVSTADPLNVGGVSNQIVLLQSRIILETNLQRQGNGNLSALVENEELNKAAVAKAVDMFKNQYFEHVSPSGIDPGKLVQNYGYEYIIEGENLILGNFASEKEVVQDWMNSLGHRANILNDRYTEIGVAIVRGVYKGDTVWIGVQEFGLPLSSCSQPDTNLENRINLDKTELDTLSSQIDENKKQIDDTDKNSAAYGQMIDDYNQLVAQYNSLAQQVKESIGAYNNQVNTFNDCVAGTGK